MRPGLSSARLRPLTPETAIQYTPCVSDTYCVYRILPAPRTGDPHMDAESEVRAVIDRLDHANLQMMDGDCTPWLELLSHLDRCRRRLRGRHRAPSDDPRGRRRAGHVPLPDHARPAPRGRRVARRPAARRSARRLPGTVLRPRRRPVVRTAGVAPDHGGPTR